MIIILNSFQRLNVCGFPNVCVTLIINIPCQQHLLGVKGSLVKLKLIRSCLRVIMTQDGQMNCALLIESEAVSSTYEVTISFAERKTRKVVYSRKVHVGVVN